jgi:hypothetical protein
MVAEKVRKSKAKKIIKTRLGVIRRRKGMRRDLRSSNANRVLRFVKIKSYLNPDQLGHGST